MFNKIKHVIFDLDGTLVDSVVVTREIINDMLVSRGYDPTLTDNDVKPYISIGGEKMMSALLGNASSDPAAEISEFRLRYSIIDTPSESLFPGTVETLEKLISKNFKLSVCSNKPHHLCIKVLSDLGLVNYFSAIVGKGENLLCKPDPSFLENVLEKTNSKVDECCYVGDSMIDLQFSKNCNIPFVYAAYGYDNLDGVPNTINEMLDLITVLGKK